MCDASHSAWQHQVTKKDPASDIYFDPELTQQSASAYVGIWVAAESALAKMVITGS